MLNLTAIDLTDCQAQVLLAVKNNQLDRVQDDGKFLALETLIQKGLISGQSPYRSNTAGKYTLTPDGEGWLEESVSQGAFIAVWTFHDRSRRVAYYSYDEREGYYQRVYLDEDALDVVIETAEANGWEVVVL